MFDQIAPRYDALNRILSLGMDGGWRRQAVAALDLAHAREVLDVATGTADVALRIARTAVHARVVGVDPSANMLAVGQGKVTAAGLDARVTLAPGECEALPFADGRFDATIIAFGIRNVPDRRRGLSELARVTRPGRPVVVLELNEPPNGGLGFFARTYVHQIVPRLGAWLSGAREYRYLQESVAAFPTPAVFADLMREAGLAVRTVQSLGFGACTLFVGVVEERTS